MIKRQIIDSIEAYAKAYGRFQKLQDQNKDFLVLGDQKTGVIGEFFGLLYARSQYPSANVKYAENPCQTGWDIEVAGPPLKIQVKTVSAFSKRRFTTPLSSGWNHLYLVFLGDDFMPRGFWIAESINDILGGQKSRKRLRMRDPDKPRSGSWIPWGENRVDDLLAVIRKHSR